MAVEVADAPVVGVGHVGDTHRVVLESRRHLRERGPRAPPSTPAPSSSPCASTKKGLASTIHHRISFVSWIPLCVWVRGCVGVGRVLDGGLTRSGSALEVVLVSEGE